MWLQHLTEYLLRVLEPLNHLISLALQCQGEQHSRTISLLVEVRNDAQGLRQYDLSSIGENDLYGLITEPEHDGMFALDPLLYVDATPPIGGLNGSECRSTLGLQQVVPEVVEEGYLLLVLWSIELETLWGFYSIPIDVDELTIIGYN